MNPENVSSSSQPAIERITEIILERHRQGHQATVDQYCQLYPEYAEQLRSFLPALLAVENLRPAANDISPPPDATIQIDGTRREVLGDYHLLREIGRGGMGIVYEAEQQSLGRRVALKVLSCQVAGTQKAIDRFQSEARAAARMHHTNIVPVFDVGQDDEHLFYAMQLIHGQSLDLVIEELKRLREPATFQGDGATPAPATCGIAGSTSRNVVHSLVHGDFPPTQFTGVDGQDSPSSAEKQHRRSPLVAETVAMTGGSASAAALPGQADLSAAESDRHSYYRSVSRIGLQTAHALTYAHARGIIHRDIKPSNLILDGAGTVWVTDFGLAKTGDHGMTNTGDVLGTIRYMSPERFQGKCDVRADLYAVGLTLYELLVLQPAYTASDQLELIEKINRVEPASPRSLDPRVPRDLETVVLKSIDKDPRHRYQSADELADDLQRYINDEPIRARRVSISERFLRWSRRNKALAASLCAMFAIVMLVAICSTIAAGYFKHQEKIQRTLVQTKTDLARKNHILANRNRKLADEKTAEAAKAIGAKSRAEELADRERQAREMVEVALTEEARQRNFAEQARQLAEAETARNRELLHISNLRLAERMWLSVHAPASAIEELLISAIPLDEQTDLRDFAWRELWYKYRHSADLSVDVDSPPAVAIAGDSRLITLNNALDLSLWKDREQNSTRTLITSSAHDSILRETSPDGQTVAVAGGNNTVEVFDVESGEARHRLDLGGLSKWMKYSSSATYLATIHKTTDAQPDSPSVGVWNVDSGEFEHAIRIRRVPSSKIGCVLSPDGTQVIIPGDPNHASFTVFTRGELAEKVVRNHRSTIRSIAWSPDGKTAASGDSNGKILLWNANTWEQMETIDAHAQLVTALAFSADSRRLASGCNDGLIRIWNLAARKSLRSLKGHTSSVTSLAFSRDGKELASASSAGVAKRWNLNAPRGGGVRRIFYVGLGMTVDEDEKGIYVAKISKDGPAAVSGVKAGDRIVRIANDAESPLMDATGLHRHEIEELLGGPAGGEVRLEVVRHENDSQETKSEYRFRRERRGTEHSLRRLARSCDGKWIATTASQATFLWNQKEPRLVRTLPYRGYGIEFSPDSETLAVNDGKFVRFWNLSQKRETGRWLVGERVGYLSYSPDGLYLAAGIAQPFLLGNHRAETPVRLWDVKAGREIAVSSGHRNQVPGVSFSPDGKRLASAGHDNTVRIWNVSDWTRPPRVLPGLRDSLSLHCVLFSPDAKSLFAGDSIGRILEWDVASGKLISTYNGHGFWVTSLTISDDGRLLASASWDRTVKLWSTNTRQELRTIEGHTDWVNSLAFAAGENSLLSVGSDGTLRFWPASHLREIDEDPFTLRSMFRFAVKLGRQNEQSKAYRLFEKTIATQRRVLGESHIHTLESISYLAGTHFNEDNYHEAARIWSDALPRSIDSLGLDHPRSQRLLTNIQLAQRLQIDQLTSQGRIQQARDVYRSAINVLQPTLGADHTVVKKYREALVHLQAQEEKADSVEP